MFWDCRIERQSVVKHYQQIWEDYQAKWKTFPLYKKLEEKQNVMKAAQEETELLKKAVEERQQELDNLKQKTGVLPVNLEIYSNSKIHQSILPC